MRQTTSASDISNSNLETDGTIQYKWEILSIKRNKNNLTKEDLKIRENQLTWIRVPGRRKSNPVWSFFKDHRNSGDKLFFF